MKGFSSEKREHARRLIFYKGLFILLFLFPVTASRAQQLQFSGFLQLDKRFNVGSDSMTIADFYNRFRLEMAAPLGEKLNAFASVDFRFYDFPHLQSLAGLEDLGQQSPTDLSLWEAYIDVYSFLFENFDLRIGKQRLSWGSADKLNPTDNLNPDDFSDLVNFAAKIPTWAVKGSYYLGDFTFTGVWLPTLTPILLPRHGASLFVRNGAAGFQDQLTLPRQVPGNSMFAFKVSSTLKNWDYSISYFKGYDDIPILKKITINANARDFTSGRFELGFPRMQVLGLDFATEISGIGFWGEGAAFFPEKVTLQTDIGTISYTSLELDDKPYYKFTIGGDYTFQGGMYLNTQWMHGFFTERGKEAIQDYFFMQLKKKLFKESLEISLGGGWEIADWRNVRHRSGFGLFPEFTYLAVDNLEMTLGSFIVDGNPATLFGTWKQADQVYLRVKVKF